MSCPDGDQSGTSGSRRGAAVTRLYLPDLVLEARDPRIDGLGRLLVRPRLVDSVHTRSLEYRADMICREPMKLFEEEEPSFF